MFTDQARKALRRVENSYFAFSDTDREADCMLTYLSSNASDPPRLSNPPTPRLPRLTDGS